MLDAWIIICALSGIALIANIGICLYTLHAAWKSETHNYSDGYIKGYADGVICTEKRCNTCNSPETAQN